MLTEYEVKKSGKEKMIKKIPLKGERRWLLSLDKSLISNIEKLPQGPER